MDEFITFIIDFVGAENIKKIMVEAEKLAEYECPNCQTTITLGASPCPKCRTPLRWLHSYA